MGVEEGGEDKNRGRGEKGAQGGGVTRGTETRAVAHTLLKPKYPFKNM